MTRNLLKYLNVDSFYFHDIAYLANSFKLRILFEFHFIIVSQLFKDTSLSNISICLHLVHAYITCMRSISLSFEIRIAHVLLILSIFD